MYQKIFITCDILLQSIITKNGNFTILIFQTLKNDVNLSLISTYVCITSRLITLYTYLLVHGKRNTMADQFFKMQNASLVSK